MGGAYAWNESPELNNGDMECGACSIVVDCGHGRTPTGFFALCKCPAPGVGYTRDTLFLSNAPARKPVIAHAA
jgi:hypothetical protein